MALLPYYDVGLATFNATDVVTFSGGASMAAAGVQPYDRIENRLGQGFAIKEILSDTSVRLTRAHTGTAQTNQPYAIWPTPSPTELMGKARNALAIAGSPFIAALAGLDGTGGDKGLTITGVSTMVTHTQTAFARAVAALTGAAGSFIRATAAGSAVMQAIVGTPAQSGGVPTGAIIGKGSNANGQWVRFADGTQICTSQALTLTKGAGYSSVAWTYPAAFISGTVPVCSVHMNFVTADGGVGRTAYNMGVTHPVNSHIATSLAINLIQGATAQSGDWSNNFITAIGRWY